MTIINYNKEKNIIDWPEKSYIMLQRLNEMKEGFPGINNNCITFVKSSSLTTQDIFISDPSFDCLVRSDLTVPLMLQNIENNKYLIHGIGKGLNLNDPDRLITWRSIQEINNIPPYVFRVDCKPSIINGGPGYYYFFKSYRDLRK